MTSSPGTSIRIQVCADAAEVARVAARRIIDVVRARPDAVLGLATGSTPEGTYTELARHHREEGLSFSGVRTFNLDEYRGLSGDHPQSYRHFMNDRLFRHLDLPLWQTHVLDGTARDVDAECRAFEQRLQAVGGVDLWLLGIGGNGHIAFNEPGSVADSRTREVHLSAETIAANSDGRFFDDAARVPRTALTAGIATIREARSVLLLATGSSKAEAVAAAVDGAPDETCPASLLQGHEDCTFLLDPEAAARLETRPT